MNGLDLFNEFVNDHVSLVVLILMFVEIAPVKIDPITTIVRYFAKKINRELNERMSNMENNIKELKEGQKESKEKQDYIEAMTSRYRIIRAAGELQNGQELFQDHLEQLGEDREIYKEYCRKHPDYKNHKGQFSMKIVDEYEKMLLKQSTSEDRLEA